MTEHEIIQAIKDNKNVCWKNKAYKVILCGEYSLYTIFEYNESMCALMQSEYKDCFIEVNKQ